MQISSAVGHASIELGLNRAERHARIAQELGANIALATQWVIPNLVCFSGSRHNVTDAEAAHITAAGLARVSGAATAAGVTLLVELLNSRVDHPGYQADRTDWGLQVCRLADAACVRLLYDIYHMQIMEGDVIRTRHCSARSPNVHKRLKPNCPPDHSSCLQTVVCWSLRLANT